MSTVAVPRQSFRPGDFVRWLWAYAAVCAVIGAMGGFFWRSIVRLPAYRVSEGGQAVISESDLRAVFSIDAWFVFVGMLLGAGLGWLAWRWFRPVGWPLTLIAAAGALLAAVACWSVPLLMAESPFYERLRAARAGDIVPVDFRLHAPIAVLVWAAAAMLPILVAASFMPDPDDPERASAPDAGPGRAGDRREV